MNLLLDSHALLWLLAGDPRLSARSREVITQVAGRIYVSAASAWEISTKHRLGKLPSADRLAEDFARTIEKENFLSLAISVGHAELAGRLPGLHKDPFDRMLIAQALIERLTLVSNETAFDAFGVSRLW